MTTCLVLEALNKWVILLTELKKPSEYGVKATRGGLGTMQTQNELRLTALGWYRNFSLVRLAYDCTGIAYWLQNVVIRAAIR